MAQPGRDVLGCSQPGMTPGTRGGNAGAVWALPVVFRLCCHPEAGIPWGNLLSIPGLMPGRISCASYSGREFPLALWADCGEPLPVAGTDGTLECASTLSLWEANLSRGATLKFCPHKWGRGCSDFIFFPRAA